MKVRNHFLVISFSLPAACQGGALQEAILFGTEFKTRKVGTAVFTGGGVDDTEETTTGMCPLWMANQF